MGGWVGQKWPKKSDIIYGWPLRNIAYSICNVPYHHSAKDNVCTLASRNTLSLFYKQRSKKETSCCLVKIIQKRLVIA